MHEAVRAKQKVQRMTQQDGEARNVGHLGKATGSEQSYSERPWQFVIGNALGVEPPKSLGVHIFAPDSGHGEFNICSVEF